MVEATRFFQRSLVWSLGGKDCFHKQLLGNFDSWCLSQKPRSNLRAPKKRDNFLKSSRVAGVQLRRHTMVDRLQGNLHPRTYSIFLVTGVSLRDFQFCGSWMGGSELGRKSIFSNPLKLSKKKQSGKSCTNSKDIHSEDVRCKQKKKCSTRCFLLLVVDVFFSVFLGCPSKLPPVNFPCLCCDRPWPGQSMATTKKPDSARAGANLDSDDRLWKYRLLALRYYQENTIMKYWLNEICKIRNLETGSWVVFVPTETCDAVGELLEEVKKITPYSRCFHMQRCNVHVIETLISISTSFLSCEMLCQDALESCCLSHNKDVNKESGQPNVGNLDETLSQGQDGAKWSKKDSAKCPLFISKFVTLKLL